MTDPTVIPLRVREVIDETPQARSLVLDVPDDWSYLPGQFLTVHAGDIGSPAARCYSLSSSPDTGELPKITVKRVADGYGSNWICDHVRAGATLQTLPAAGAFTPSSLDRDLLLCAAGSGITPVMSILKSVLVKGPGQLMLLYANEDRDSIIFADELESLGAEHPDRLTVQHWLVAEQGLPTAQDLRELLAPYLRRETFLCGPEPFMDLVKEITGPGIHIEKFASLTSDPFHPAEAAETDRVARVEVEIDGRHLTLDWPAGKKLLDLLEEHGLNPPFSCRQGICGACACRIEKGEVRLLNNEILEEEDFADGYILACQALPITDEVGITYS